MDKTINQRHFSASGSQLNGILKSQNGFTLIEALITAAVIVGIIVAIYTGIMYAENQILQNYRDRVATLLASGELEMQHYYYVQTKSFRPFTNKDVVIDFLGKNKALMGKMNMEILRGSELASGRLLTFNYLVVKVSWVDPKTKKSRYISVREDYYK